jgi:hypothetical protein
LVERAAADLAAAVVVPELDGRSADARGDQQATIASVMDVLGQRAKTLQQAAREVMDMPAPAETAYTPISAADAVIRYAGDFVPSWAGAISIDLLPAVLVLIIAVAQGAIRAGRKTTPIEDRMTLSELRAAVVALRDVETVAGPPPLPTQDTTTPPPSAQHDPERSQP